MADKKISQLSSASTPLAGTEVLPIVQSSTTVKVSVADLTAGRAVAASTVNVDADSASAAVRITQIGAGNALVVEDSANPDATPFVVTASGDLGVGTSLPNQKMQVVGSNGTGFAGATLQNSNGNIGIAGVQFSSDTTYSKAAIGQVRENANGTGPLVFYVDSAVDAADWSTGDEKMRIAADGEVHIAGLADQGAYNLQVNGTGVWGAGAYVNGSDARIKDDIAPLTSGLDVVAKLKPVQFRYKESWAKDTLLQPGFIAQDLQTALADQPYADGVVVQGPEYMSVAYQTLIPLLTKAIQEQQVLIEDLRTRLTVMESR